MSLRRRGGIWWIDVTAPNGERVRRTTRTSSKALAQEQHDTLKARLWQPEPPTPERKWDEAVVRWLKEQAHKATAGEDVTKLRWLHPFLGGKHLEDIDRALIDRITQAKLAQGCANATVNRTLEVLRAILRKCVNDWEWLARAPKIRMLKQSTRRIRYLTREEAARLLAELPPHLADMATVSLATGLRAANVTGMEWTQVDFERRVAWVHPDQAKARRAIAIPLTDEVIAVLRSWEGKHPTHVFCFRGKPITQVSTKAWYGALKRAGIAQFRWHDLRHTWASWHVQVGTPLFALQEMAGWESAEMVRRYAHLNAGHLAPYADRLGAVRAAQ